MSLNKNPIPAFYCCYLLRSTKKASALYVGSTPNPRRRLAQHNGKSIGGAVRTAQENLRPWEMACVVTGFPSNIAALQFEWAWQNSHLTKRIAEDQRITVKKTRVYTNQKTGCSRRRPTRPRTSLIDRLSNLHLLLRVRSFARWPLEVRFFCQDVYDVWLRWSERTHGEIRAGINILLDLERFDKPPENDEPPPSTQAKQRRKKSMIGKGGVDGVDVGYSTLKDHLEKSRFLLPEGERNSCVTCAKDFGSRSAMALVCPHKSCSAAFHMTCLARHFLIVEEQKTSIIPTSGTCPQCESKLQWIDLVKELSVRIRGDDEIARLMKKPEARQGKAAKSKKTSSSHFITDTTENEIYTDRDRELKEGSLSALSDFDEPLSDGWQYLDQDEDDGVSVASGISEYSDCVEAKAPARSKAREPSLEIVIEDSDWDDAEALD